MNHQLLFDEIKYKSLPEKTKSAFIYDWLCLIDKEFSSQNKDDLRKILKPILNQISNLYFLTPGPPIRSLIAKVTAKLLELGDVICLFETIEKCNNILKGKEDSKSQKTSRFCSLNVIGAIYEALGEKLGRVCEESFQILSKFLKQPDIDMKLEVLLTIEKMVKGIKSNGAILHKDLYKQLKPFITDTSPELRSACAKVIYLIEMLISIHLEIISKVSICWYEEQKIFSFF